MEPLKQIKMFTFRTLRLRVALFQYFSKFTSKLFVSVCLINGHYDATGKGKDSIIQCMHVGRGTGFIDFLLQRGPKGTSLVARQARATFQ
jgi:hypothetical protein